MPNKSWVDAIAGRWCFFLYYPGEHEALLVPVGAIAVIPMGFQTSAGTTRLLLEGSWDLPSVGRVSPHCAREVRPSGETICEEKLPYSASVIFRRMYHNIRYSIIVNSPRPIQNLAFSCGGLPGKVAPTCVYLLWISCVR